MRLVTWILRLAIFLFLVAFAAKNTHPATLQFYFGLAWEAPLVVQLLAFFILGALLGLMALFATVLRQRRELLALRRRLPRGTEGAHAGAPGVVLPPAVDG